MDKVIDMTKIALFDFDNTLYSHKTYTIPESTKKALKELKEKGVIIVLATGRCEFEMETYFDIEEYGFDYRVLQNGQIIIDKEKNIIYSAPITGIDKENALKIFQNKTIPMILATIDDYYLNYANDQVRTTVESVSSPVPEIKEYDGKDFYMMSIFPGEAEHFDEFIKVNFPNCYATIWTVGSYDILYKGCDKGNGLKRLADLLDIDIKDTIAFGDADNDIALIESAGIGVALGNSCDNLKKVADYVTDDIDEDGLYNALKHFNII